MGILNFSKESLGKAKWNALAELDPLWTILSEPQKKFGKWELGDFFYTGEREVDRVLKMCRSFGLSVPYGTLLDFGCGVGRMTRAFSHHFESCIGIDVSEKMIHLATKCNDTLPNCRFIASDAEVLPFPDNSFDFVFTLLVLQHLPKKSTILRYIEEFLRVARDSGVIVFQLPNEVPIRRRLQVRRRLWTILESLGVSQVCMFNKLGLAPILMNGISKKEIENFLVARGGGIAGVERYDPSEAEYHSYYYVVVKKPTALQRAGETAQF